MGRFFLVLSVLLFQTWIYAANYEQRHSLDEVKEFIAQENISEVDESFYNSLTESEEAYLKSWDLNFLRKNKNDQYYQDWKNGVTSIVSRKRNQETQPSNSSTNFNQCTIEARLVLASCLSIARKNFDGNEEEYCFAKHYDLEADDRTPTTSTSTGFKTKRLLQCCEDAGKDKQVCRDLLHTEYRSEGFNEETKLWSEQSRAPICSITNFRVCSESSNSNNSPLRLWPGGSESR